MAARTRDRESAGRLLRVLGDCELFHMEAAITSLQRVKTGIRSESLLKPSGEDNADVLERTAEGRVLSLSDHKRIARLQAALITVANAYDIQDKVDETEDVDSSRNLVCAVAGAAMMQSMRDCTASRTNCCIWGPQAEKLHVLLNWMMHLESEGGVKLSTCDYVRQLILEWIKPTAEKQNQLAACLTLFELVQRRYRKLKSIEPGDESVCLLEDRVGTYLDALRAIVERGTTRIADSNKVKLSKLALVALETLALLCGGVAAQFMVLNERAKETFVDDGSMRKTVESMRFFLVTLRQWHLHSTRRQFLGYALQHLQSYVEACGIVLSSVNGVGCDSTRDSDVNSGTVLNVLCWHWEASAPMLCTRTDVSTRLQKHQPSKVLAQVLKKWTFDTFVCNGAVVTPEVVYAQVRYVCVLMDSIGGVKACSKTFGEFSEEVKACFVFYFVQGLSTATKNGDDVTVLLILKILRAVLLVGDAFKVLSSQEEEQELLSQLLRLHNNASVSGSWPEFQTELEMFVADFIISRALFITGLVRRVQDSHTPRVLTAISLVRTFLYQLDSATQTPLYQHWRKQLTPKILDLITHENYRVRRLAISCLASLDPVPCIAELTATALHNAENQVVTLALGYLFAASTRYSLETMALWFLDACQFGSVQSYLTSDKAPVSPHEWNDYATQPGRNGKENFAVDDKRKELQEKLLSLCFGPTGWSKEIQTANARGQVLRVLLHKIFGSPRDPVLLRMLREFAACGWVNHEVFELMGNQICAHMMNVPRLTEEILDDNSTSAAKTIERLLFSRLAPLLVLRMLPRDVFRTKHTKTLPVRRLGGRVDLDHLNEYIDRQLQVDCSDAEAISEVTIDTMSEILFHILARSIVDPLEFKEVKMLATECLSKFSPPIVLPFVLAYLVAFLREATPDHERDSSLIVAEDSVPGWCGLVTAKLMVYYFNRVFAEDGYSYKDCGVTSRALALLVQILGIPSVQDSDEALLTDLQRGCIDCIALILSRLTANDSGQDMKKALTTRASSLMDLLITWIFGIKNGEDYMKKCDAEGIGSRVQKLLETMWSKGRYDQFPMQVRICCCNVLLSAISRSEINVLTSWKTQGFISRIAFATETCSEDDVVAGGLQIIFSFLYKASESLSMEDNSDLQLVRICFDATTVCLESTRSESVAVNGLKVVGALIRKLPGFIGTLPPEVLQRLIDRCLVAMRDRRVSPVVSELAQSLLQAMTPP